MTPMSKKIVLGTFVALVLLVSLQATANHNHDHSGNSITIAGSTTVNNFVFNTNVGKDTLQDLGFGLDIHPSSSGRGMLALSEGTADIAMISSCLPKIVRHLNKRNNTDINTDDYEVHRLSKTKILFIVHPDNPIKSLSREQIKGLFTGKIKDWSEVGADNLGPVKIVSEHATGGVYNTVLHEVTDMEPITNDRITMQNGPQTAVVISQLPNGFGMLSAATPDEQKNKVSIVATPDFEASQNMSFVTKKDQNKGKILKFITAIQEKLKL